jgi:hypothetical protein
VWRDRPAKPRWNGWLYDEEKGDYGSEDQPLCDFIDCVQSEGSEEARLLTSCRAKYEEGERGEKEDEYDQYPASFVHH